MDKLGTLLVISGFSGVGKGTIVNRIMETHDNYALSISATTRAPRQGETDGVSYFFKTVEDFENMIANNQLLEYASYVGNYYGTPKEYVLSKLSEGINVILEIESVGAFNVKKMFPEAVLLFVIPPSGDELERRLRGRGTEDEATIKARLSKAVLESEGIENYDYVIVNDTIEESIVRIDGIVAGDEAILDECAMKNNNVLVNDIKNDLLKFSKGE